MQILGDGIRSVIAGRHDCFCGEWYQVEYLLCKFNGL